MAIPFGIKQSMSLQEQTDLRQKIIKQLQQIELQNWNGVLPAAFSGAAQGIISGLETATNGATLSGYDWLNQKLNLGKLKRQQAVQQLAESSNLGTAYQIADGVAELGGGMRGVAAKIWDLGATTTKIIPIVKNSTTIAPVIGGAGLSSLVDNSFKYDFSDLEKIGLGTLKGTAAAAALIALQNGAFDVLKRIYPEANLAGLKGGIDNVVQNERAAAILQKGISVNQDLAQNAANQLSAASGRINQTTQNAVNQVLTQRIDIPQTVANSQNQFNNYLQQHAADEVLDATPVVTRYTSGDSIQILKSIRKNMQKQEPEFKMAIDKNGNIDYPHFTKDNQRVEYLQTLPETYKNPDKIIFAKNNNNLPREYRMKEYYNPDNKQRVYDVDIKSDDGTLITKFAREGKNGKNYYNKIEDMGLTSQASETARGPGQTWTAHIPDSPRTIYITPQKNVVNPNLPHISELYKGLTSNQGKLLNEIFDRTLQQSNAKAGSFESLQRATAELDKIMAEKHITGYIDSQQNAEIYDLKNRITKYLGTAYNNEALKAAKVKTLEQAYLAGQQAKPQPQQLSKIEQNAYAQGQFNNMASHNANQNLAQNVLQEQNIHNQLYQKDIQWLQQQSEAYNRSKLLEQQAVNQSFINHQPRNYIEKIKYYLETEAGRKALNKNFDGTHKWYSRQPEPYFVNSAVQNCTSKNDNNR